MKQYGRIATMLVTALTIALAPGCAEKKTTKSVTVETPEKKYEIEVEKTERKK
jgi:hypothetical protein